VINASIIEKIKEKIYTKADVGTEEIQKMVKEFFDIYQTEVHDKVMAEPDVIFLFKNFEEAVNNRPEKNNSITHWKIKNKNTSILHDNILKDPDTDRELLDAFGIFNDYYYYNNTNGIDYLKELFPEAFKKLDPIAKKIMKCMKVRKTIEREVDRVLKNSEITMDDVEEFAKTIYEIYNGE
jgi:hypothetical protein